MVRDGATWRDTPYFRHYFERSASSIDVQTFPKFIVYMGHAETTAPLLASFGHHISTVHRPIAGSAFFLEFYKAED